MKPTVIAVILVLMVSALGIADTFDSENLNLVTFTNRTAAVIEFIFLSPGDSEYWGPEILGSERTLDVGSSLGFFFLIQQFHQQPK